ncbi:MAG: hypothetical protein ABSG79_22475 [Bryobacteraceae bacterium]|jgi:hypothetical protein
MSESNYGHPGNEGPERDRVHHDHRPYWKRAHHDWRVWVGLFFMLGAITIYVMSNDLSFFGQMHRPPPAAVGN